MTSSPPAQNPAPSPETRQLSGPAVVVVSFGGPRGNDEVMPFLRNVTSGRGVPDERLAVVAEHYYARGGVSPINAANERLVAALQQALTAVGADLPVYVANRVWSPFVVDVLREMWQGGHQRVVAVLTSGFASYSGCRQYREALWSAVESLRGEGHQIPDSWLVVAPHYCDAPWFVASHVEQVERALSESGSAHVVAVTHSIPVAMEQSSGRSRNPGSPVSYVDEHRAVAEKVMAQVTGPVEGWSLAFCSRSGPPQQPWLEPDINDHLASLAEQGVRRVLVWPLGFQCDHMEVVQDLDTEARATAEQREVAFGRVATISEVNGFVRGLAEWALTTLSAAQEPDHPWCLNASQSSRTYLGLPPVPAQCQPDCCPNLRAPDTKAWGDLCSPVAP